MGTIINYNKQISNNSSMIFFCVHVLMIDCILSFPVENMCFNTVLDIFFTLLEIEKKKIECPE